MKLSYRLTVQTFVVQGLVFAFMGIFLITFFNILSYRILDGFLEARAQGIASDLTSYWDTEFHNRTRVPSQTKLWDAVFAEDFHSQLNEIFSLKGPYPFVAALYDKEGLLRFSSHSPDFLNPPGEATIKTVLRGAVHAETSGNWRIVSFPAVFKGKTVAFVQVISPLESLESTLIWGRILLFILLPFLLIFHTVSSLLILRSGLKPLMRIIKTADKIEKDKLDLRIPIPKRGDELKELTETLNQMLDRLQNSFRVQEELFQDLSHQLKTPLAILQGTLETALSESRSKDEYVAALESGLEEVDRVRSLVQSLLLLARLDSKQYVLKLEKTDLRKLLLQIIEDFQPLWEQKNLQWDIDGLGTFPVLIDVLRFRQTLANLVDNQIRYAPEGTSISVQIISEGIKIENRGPDLDEAILEKIFDRFFRKNDLGEGGFGLGLPIARSIVRAHGGDLKAYRPHLGGAGFFLYCPPLS